MRDSMVDVEVRVARITGVRGVINQHALAYLLGVEGAITTASFGSDL
jgi:hypothetical protein